MPPDLGTAGLPQPESIGRSSMLTNGVEYGWTGRPVQVEASATGSLRYYPAVDEIRIVNGSALVAVTAPLPARSVVAFSQTAAYTPSYLYSLFPPLGGAALGEAPPPPSPDYAVNGSASYSYTTALTLAYNPLGVKQPGGGRRPPANGDQGWGARTRQDLTVKAVQGQYGRRLRRTVTATALYRYRSSYSRSSDHVRQVLGNTPSTASKSACSTAGPCPRPASSPSMAASVPRPCGSRMSLKARSVTRRPYRLLGDVRVGYRFRRTWQASGSLPRQLRLRARSR